MPAAAIGNVCIDVRAWVGEGVTAPAVWPVDVLRLQWHMNRAYRHVFGGFSGWAAPVLAYRSVYGGH